jgi:hypothetical protein
MYLSASGHLFYLFQQGPAAHSDSGLFLYAYNLPVAHAGIELMLTRSPANDVIRRHTPPTINQRYHRFEMHTC